MIPATIIAELARRDLLGLVDEVCRLRHVTRDELCGRGRTKAVASARREVWWRLRHHPNLSFSYPELGRLFARDHATIIAGVRVHDRTRRQHDRPPAASEV